MTTKSKQLVSAGHELASELKADCGAVDMRSVANLLTELASALDVQSARSDALTAKLNDVCAENAALKATFDKPQAYLSWHAIPPTWDEPLPCGEYLDVHDTDGHKNSDGTDCWPVFAKPEIETPNTDAWVNEQRDAILDAAFEAAKQEVERRFGRTFQDCAWLARRNSDTQMKGAVEMAEWVELYAAQLRGSQV